MSRGDVMDLTAENVFGLLQATEEFPIDFDDAWKWIGYGEKSDNEQNARRAARRALFREFERDLDFRTLESESTGGRPRDLIVLSIDCFKSFAMMAGTARGKQVRHYFLQCERHLKELLAQQQTKQKARVIRALVQDDADPWAKRFDDEYFDEAYRITGWKRPNKGHPACMGRLINETVYDYFPEGVPEHLRKLNPKNENGHRPRKHHQHLTPTLGLPVLASQKAATIAVMRLSPSNNPKRFKANMAKACGSQIQIELPFMDDFSQLGGAS